MKKTTTVTMVLMSLSLIFSAFVFGQGKTALAVVFRSLGNPYQAEYQTGAEALAQRLGGNPVDVLVSEGDTSKEMNDIKGEIARRGGNVVFYIDPNDSSEILPIAKIMESAGVYWVDWWSKPLGGVHAWDFPHFVAFINYDGEPAGAFTADALFKSFKTPYHGEIIALQGRLGDTVNGERWDGLQKVLKQNPGVKLDQWESAEWDRTKAYNDVKSMLVAYPHIDGVWCANDTMALGTIQALKEAGLEGKVKVSGTDGISEMFAAIKSGLAVATVMNDGKFQAELGLSMALAAKNGKLDVASLPHKYRQFAVPAVSVDANNVDQIINDYVNNTPEYDLSNFFATWSRTEY